jgi:aspartate--ammonia ligase
LAFLRGTGVNDELDGTVSKSPVRFIVPNQDIPRGISNDIQPHHQQVMVDPSHEQQQQQQQHQDIKEKLVDDNTTNTLPPSYEMDCEVVQSLAKWKRIMLDRLECGVGQGIYCDSTSIRKGYKGDVTHSVIADQWDYEICLAREQRTLEQLQAFVRIIWRIITDAEDYILDLYPQILLSGHATAAWRLPKEITFVTAQELHDRYPGLDVHGRENAAVNQHGAIFIIGMGWPMSDGSAAEEVRSPGYDDWNLNGDIVVRHPLTEYRHELSSMGIRVDKDALLKQLEHRGVLHEQDMPFQKAVIEEKLPFSYGGGIGISRLLMLLLRTCHIGEVQVGLWHDAHYEQARAAGMDLIPDRIVEIPSLKTA